MALEGRRVLFISYNGMLDPLGQSQVLPYLRGLARRGVRFTLLSFERPHAFESKGLSKSEELRRHLANENIQWHWLRYHQKPSLPATVYDVAAGVSVGVRLVKQNEIEMVHARSQIPATIALALKKRFSLKMIFDVRGLMAEEYVDAEHWRQGSVPYRLTKTIERRSLAAAEGVVTLTEKVWPIIREWEGLAGRDVVHEVIPCCADLELFRFRSEDRVLRRRELALGDRFTIVYCGSIDGWYLTDQMADFFAHFLQKLPEAHFLWLTLTKHNRIRSLMAERGIGARSFTVLSAESGDIPSYLAASDVGLAFIKPCFSKLASSPVKIAEYLACGLPVIINAGIGDYDVLMSKFAVGTLVNEFTPEEYSLAASRMETLARDGELTSRRSRETAEKLFDLNTVGIERYSRLYERVFSLGPAKFNESQLESTPI